jgi:8-oxo-dGTP pyrophosphatase MutT (NUDIX family)
MVSIKHAIPQAAAIPVRVGHVCLITSRNGKRWLVPKGCLEFAKSAAEIAQQEAWEEAGLTGVLEPEPVGSYLYRKSGNLHSVTVFLLHVTDASDDWPEAAERRRCWVPLNKATSYIERPELRELLARVAKNLALRTQHGKKFKNEVFEVTQAYSAVAIRG